MIVAKYPATYGHTSVIDNLCTGLNKIGFKAAIGAFSFEKNPPNNIEKIKLNKSKLLTSGVQYLDFDIIHPHQSRVLYYLLAVKPKKPVILHYHGASSRIQEINFKIAMNLFKNRITKIISVSHAGVNQIKRIAGNFPTCVIYNGVDTEFFNHNLPNTYKKGEPQLLFVSALRHYKNSPILVSVMPSLLKKYPNSHLQIVGDGEDLQKLINLVKEKNLQKHVEIIGKISNEELKLRYSSCDMYISASTFEVCPVPTLEAMACGKPLLLYSIEPHVEMINVSNAGMIFSSFNHDEICEKIEEVYKKKKNYKTAARKFAEEHNWPTICKQVAALYEENFNQ